MGWFDEQIRQRMQSDQEMLEDSFFRMASVVLDKWDAQRIQDDRLIAKEALDEILKFYRQKPVEIPEEITDLGDQLEYALRPAGLMLRDVELEDGWQKDAYGPMLAFLKDSRTAVALLPGTLYGYYYRDPATGKKVRVTRRTAKLFSPDALCFYRPLPMKKLGVPDLLLYMKNCISHGDLVLILLAALAVTLVGQLEPRIYALLTGPVLQNRQMNVMGGIAAFLLAAAFSSQLLEMIRSLLMERIDLKTSLAVEASVMMRLLSLPVSFFRKYASGDLASRASSVNSLCSMMLNNILSTGLSSLLSLIYITTIFSYAPVLVWPSLLIILSTVL